METIVTITEEGGKWHMEGTTYIDTKPWPVDLNFDTEADALKWVEKHGWTVQA